MEEIEIDEACAHCDATKDLEPCVACARPACKAHRGDENAGYWNLSGKKGYACGPCIRESMAYEGGAWARVGEMQARIQQDLKALGPALLQDTEEVAARLTKESLDRIEDGATRLTGVLVTELEAASSRLAEQIFKALDASVEKLNAEAQKLTQHALDELKVASDQILTRSEEFLDAEVTRLEAAIQRQSQGIIEDADEAAQDWTSDLSTTLMKAILLMGGVAAGLICLAAALF